MATWVTVALALLQVIQGLITGGDKIRLKRKKNRAKMELRNERKDVQKLQASDAQGAEGSS
jgi:hypothetical protein